jgi:hypothetical protein
MTFELLPKSIVAAGLRASRTQDFGSSVHPQLLHCTRKKGFGEPRRELAKHAGAHFLKGSFSSGRQRREGARGAA